MNDQYQQARPDVFASVPTTTLALYLAALLACVALARFVWVLRRG